MEEKIIIYSAQELNKRLKLNFRERLAVFFFKSAREFLTQELITFDNNKKREKKILASTAASRNKFCILSDFQAELTGDVSSQTETVTEKMMARETLQGRNSIFVETLKTEEEIRKLEEERYCAANLARILASIYVYFSRGYANVGVFYSNSGVDFESIAKQIEACSEKEYYVFANNLLDEDELSIFGNIPMTGIVISKKCPKYSLCKLIKSYFQDQDVFGVYILPID